MQLNDLQLEKISDILIQVGVVFVATNVVPVLNNQSVSVGTIIESSIIAMELWIASIHILSYINQKEK